MKIGFIGAGKAGCSIGRYLADSGAKDCVLTGYYSRSFASAEWAAEFTRSRAYENLKALLEVSDTLMIGTPDGEIKAIWDCITDILSETKRDLEVSEKLMVTYVCHFSGSLSSDVFLKRENFGIKACSLHPMYPFSSKSTSYEKLNKAVFTVEGDDIACEAVGGIFKKLGNTVSRISPDNKVKYHAAASIVSNSVLALLDLGESLLLECGFSKDEAFRAVSPLVENNIQSCLKMGVRDALTGPIERGDVETVNKHILALGDGDAALIYRLLGKRLADISKKKHPERDYQSLEDLLNEKYSNNL